MHRHIAQGLIVVALIVGMTGVGSAQKGLEGMDALLAKYNKAGVFNGSVLVARGDEVLYRGAVGKAVIEWDVANTPDTRFRIGSVTKQFTAALILQFVEDGKIALDAPLSRYLPDYPKAQADKVTIHHLLTHTSGIPSYTGLPDFGIDMMRRHVEPDSFLTVFSGLPLEFEPGTRWRYDNSGYFILGVVIAHVTGKPYDLVLRERILDPLGLENTGYDHNDAIIPLLASGYQRMPGGYQRAPFMDSNLPYAAGMLYSNAGDLLKWTRALHAGQVFKNAESLRSMITPFLENYGYGLQIMNLPAGKDSVRVIRHSGGINGFSSQLWYLPDDGYTIVTLDNTTANSGIVADAAFRLLHGLDVPEPRMPIADELVPVIEREGIDAAVAHYHELKSEKADAFDFSEQQLNELGCVYLNRGDIDIAKRLLALNIEMYPEAFNVWDSMGEAHMKAGEKDKAIAHYRKALELNPGSTNARQMLAKLGITVEDKTVTVNEAVLEEYVGIYELVPGFTLTIMRDGTQLYEQATNQESYPIFPSSDTKFYLTVVDAQITFVRGEKGDVASLILHQGGRDMPAKRIAR